MTYFSMLNEKDTNTITDEMFIPINPILLSSDGDEVLAEWLDFVNKMHDYKEEIVEADMNSGVFGIVVNRVLGQFDQD